VTTECFIPRNFRPDGLKLIEQANAIIDEYMAQGFALTIRQLHYQFVARDLYANTPDNYKKLDRFMTWARDAGMVDWDAIEDRTREVMTHQSWRNPEYAVADAARWYQEDLWADQKWRPEVWIEKEALVGVIEEVCGRYRVPYLAQRGSASTTIKYQAGDRFAGHISQDHVPVVIYLGDHDPTGIDITRDNAECLALYACEEVEVRRIALTMAQVEQYSPPPNFAKEADANFAKYEREFGTEQCWELDALSPDVIATLVEKEIKKLIKPRPWKLALAKEAANKRTLAAVADDWERIAETVR
jgi:hypothetical protein